MHRSGRSSGRAVAGLGTAALLCGLLGTAATVQAAASAGAATGIPVFATGQLQSKTVGATGCGTNAAGEPAIHISRANNLFAGSELGVGSGSELWRQIGTTSGSGASACALQYRGQPNAVASGTGPAGGDIDIAIASAKNSAGNYNVYVASLNLGSVNVATSANNGTTFSQTPVQAGLPLDDREWIAAYGAQTSLLTYHDVASSEIDVLRSDNSGLAYHQIARAIPLPSAAATNNELGNIVVDHDNTAGTTKSKLDMSGTPGFWAYQSFVAPGASSDSNLDEMFVAVSNNGGYNWTDRPIGCSYERGGTIAHNFPNVSVAPNGRVWAAWSDDAHVYTAASSDHGITWTCSHAVSTGLRRAIFPWLAATSSGVDLVYYATSDPSGPSMTWSVYLSQNRTATATGWATPTRVSSVHRGDVCEGGVTCTTGRQLFDDFGIDTDSRGNAHIVYSHDSPSLGGAGAYTGYAVQTAGQTVGTPNN